MARASGAVVFISCIAIVLSCLQYATVAQSTPFNMSLGSIFKGSQTIQSRNQLFELGLFKPPNANFIYLGIWYTDFQPRTVVWVGNRNKPAVGSASFSLSSEGELTVLNSDKSVLWSSPTTDMNVSTAVLMDTGKLVLQTANSSPVWDSFKHPANVWLPTMALGLGTPLISWKTPSDPAEGLYSLQMRETGEFVSVWNNSRQYWTSGVWNGKIFANVPEMTNTWIYNFSFDLTTGFTWFVYPNQKDFSNSRFTIETNGQVSQKTWPANGTGWQSYWTQPRDQCAVYAACGQYGVCNSSSSAFCSCPSGFEPADPALWDSIVYSSGCKHTLPLDCKAGNSSDVFLPLNNAFFDTEDSSLPLYGVDEELCRSACLKNCSCAAYHHDTTTKNCFLMSQVLWNSTTVSSEFHLRVSVHADINPALPTTKNKSSSVGIVAGAVAGGGVLILFILGFFLFRRHGLSGSKHYIPGVLNRFSYRQLQSATKNFTEGIGRGGFGEVFKGVLPGNTLVAVKKLQRLDQGDKQFRAEVSTIGTIQHVNLVRLLGFCSEGSRRLLVLEYMPNGSLDHSLFKRSAGVLDWKTRFTIALGTARAIAYLHEECRECIIHCDIKPENILLDADFCPKVSDFGLAKLVGREFSHVLTSMRGTRGYLAPEWISGLPITAKADVYSFGMTLLEVVSGRRNLDTSWGREKGFFPLWAAMQVSYGEVRSLVDERLEGEVEEEELRRVVYAAIWCIQDDEELRPGMGKVVQILEGALHIPKPPLPTSVRSLIEAGYTSSATESTSPLVSPLAGKPLLPSTVHLSHDPSSPIAPQPDPSLLFSPLPTHPTPHMSHDPSFPN